MVTARSRERQSLPPFVFWLKPVGCRVTQFWIWPIPILYTTHHDSYISVSTSISGTVDQHGVSWNQTSTDSCSVHVGAQELGKALVDAAFLGLLRGMNLRNLQLEVWARLNKYRSNYFSRHINAQSPTASCIFFNLSWFNGDYHDWCDFSWSSSPPEPITITLTTHDVLMILTPTLSCRCESFPLAPQGFKRRLCARALRHELGEPSYFAGSIPILLVNG